MTLIPLINQVYRLGLEREWNRAGRDYNTRLCNMEADGGGWTVSWLCNMEADGGGWMVSWLSNMEADGGGWTVSWLSNMETDGGGW